MNSLYSLVLLAAQSNTDVTALKAYVIKLGYKASNSSLVAIKRAANTYALDPELMVRIAIVESGINNKRVNYNTNGTYDTGLFQINSSVSVVHCKEYNIQNETGNALCAAKLLAEHKQFSNKDPYWIGRYNSKTPSIKKAYYKKVEGLANVGR